MIGYRRCGKAGSTGLRQNSTGGAGPTKDKEEHNDGQDADDGGSRKASVQSVRPCLTSRRAPRGGQHLRLAVPNSKVLSLVAGRRERSLPE